MSSPFNPIQPLNARITPFQPLKPEKSEKEVIPGFQEMFIGAINSVQAQFDEIGEKVQQLMTGKLTNLHDVMISGEKTGIMLKLATSIASKISTACTTLFQMQI